MHRRSRGSGGGNGTGLGSPRSRRIREADSFSRSNVGAGRGDFGAGRRRSRSNGSNGSNGSTGSNINNAGYGASMAAAAGSGGRVGLEIQAELVAALAKCEAALKQKTHEVHKLNTQLANARSEAGLSGKQAQEQLSRVRADMEELRERSNEVRFLHSNTCSLQSAQLVLHDCVLYRFTFRGRAFVFAVLLGVSLRLTMPGFACVGPSCAGD